MTPLIDITFILLLFFILETRFSEFRTLWLPLPLPSSAAPGEAPRTLRLEVFADGRIWAEGVALDRAGLDAFLRQRGYAPQTSVELAAEPAVVLQSLVEISDVLHARGLSRIDIRGLAP
jgi:biopolymer transport protein ExbD